MLQGEKFRVKCYIGRNVTEGEMLQGETLQGELLQGELSWGETLYIRLRDNCPGGKAKWVSFRKF